MIRLQPLVAPYDAELRLSLAIGNEYNRIIESGAYVGGPVPPEFRDDNVVARSPINPVVLAITRAVLAEISLQLAATSIVIDDATTDETMITKMNLAVLERVVFMCNTEIDRRMKAEASK